MSHAPQAFSAPQADPTRVELGVLSDILGFRLRRIQNQVSLSLSQTLAERGLKPTDFSALAIIAANPGISQIEVAREGGYDKASVVTMVDDLERRGWATRERSKQDRRRHALLATAEGEKALLELAVVARANEARFSTVLTQAELASLRDMLDRMYALCISEQAD